MENRLDCTVKDGQGSDSAKPNPLQNEAAKELSSRVHVVCGRAELLDTMQPAIVGTRLGDSDKNTEMGATIMVRSKASEKEMDETLAKITAHEMKPLNAKDFNDKFGADPQSMERVEKFARDNGLTVAEADLASGRIELKGKVGEFSQAFKVKLSDYKNDDGEIARERLGTISVPKEIATDVQAVLGLETRPDAEALYQKQDKSNLQFAPRESSGFLPTEVANAYDFPKESMGAGQSVGIIELGGGLDLESNAQYYKEHGLPIPKIQIVGVDGADNDPNNPDPKKNADGEVALDSQIIGAVAPDANQQLIFAPNDAERGFIDAVTRATFAREGEKQNSVISISWGGRETGTFGWDAQSVQSMDLALKKAALKGITVFAAAGDSGAGDVPRTKPSDGKLVADYPASDPWVTACGGTEMTLDMATGKPKEVVWNRSDASATGGGVSQIFAKPDYQKGIEIPQNPNPAHPDGPHAGRGEPDVAGDASPVTGYTVRFSGDDNVLGGTSAVAPLYAALMMRVNGTLGQPAGFLNPFLYKHGHSGIFNDVTVGDNRGFKAGPGWDAASGWGSIRGTEFLKQLRDEQHMLA